MTFAIIENEGEEYQRFWEALRAGQFRSDRYLRIGKHGREVWLQASYNPIFDLNGRPFKIMKIAADVSTSVILAAQVVLARNQAEHDPATGLPNRLGLRLFMNAELSRAGRRLAILYLDLDHFKPINDTFGHAVGDHVLEETADRLRRILAPGQIAARIGGDEFIVAAPDLTDESVDDLCRRLIKVVKQPIRHDSNAITVGLSIGVAMSPHDAATADALLRCADIALYRTKGNGRDGYSFFAPTMDERFSVNRHLADELRHGLQAGQFYLEFQPRFELGSHALREALALVRWNHPEPRRIANADFIDLAEKSGLILRLGEWALQTACRTVADWPGTGVVVPISAVHFAATDVPALVASVLDECGLEPTRLILQIAERVLVADPERALDNLQKLRSMGVRLRLEGHGTHHASLAAISAYPFHEVAIDPRFIVDLPSEDIGERIARDFQLASAALDAVASVAGTATSTHALLLTLGETTQVRAFWCGPALKEEAWSDLLASKDGERSESDRVTSAASPSVPHSSNEMAPAAPTLQPVASIAETS